MTLITFDFTLPNVNLLLMNLFFIKPFKKMKMPEG